MSDRTGEPRPCYHVVKVEDDLIPPDLELQLRRRADDRNMRYRELVRELLEEGIKRTE